MHAVVDTYLSLHLGTRQMDYENSKWQVKIMPLRERAKQTESEKVKKKTFVFLRVKGIYHFFNFERK